MKVVLKPSPIHGVGVFAAVDIPKGAPILRIDDSRIVLFHLPRPLRIEYLALLDDWYIEEYREQVKQLLDLAGIRRTSSDHATQSL